MCVSLRFYEYKWTTKTSVSKEKCISTLCKVKAVSHSPSFLWFCLIYYQNHLKWLCGNDVKVRLCWICDHYPLISFLTLSTLLQDISNMYVNGVQFYAHSLTTPLNCNVRYLTVCYHYLIFCIKSEFMYMCVWIIHIFSFSSENKQNFSKLIPFSYVTDTTLLCFIWLSPWWLHLFCHITVYPLVSMVYFT